MYTSTEEIVDGEEMYRGFVNSVCCKSMTSPADAKGGGGGVGYWIWGCKNISSSP